HDCLHEAMDFNGWLAILRHIEAGEIALVARDTREPSPFSHQLINANVYAFLDDAPLEERRARAVAVRRAFRPQDVRDLGQLDPVAIAQVRSEAWPLVRDAEELHDTLLSIGALPEREGAEWTSYFDELNREARVARCQVVGGPALWVAVEQWPVVQAAVALSDRTPPASLPDALRRDVTSDEARMLLVRGRLEISGPTTARRIAAELGMELMSVQIALEQLELSGVVLRGRFTNEVDRPVLTDRREVTTSSFKTDRRPSPLAESSGQKGTVPLSQSGFETASSGPAVPSRCARSEEEGLVVEWCERRLLARIHRLTLDGLRRQVAPVEADAYLRFLLAHHEISGDTRPSGTGGVQRAVSRLQGFESPLGAWEHDLLPVRVEYDIQYLDQLFASGETVWGRLQPPRLTDDSRAQILNRVSPITLLRRADLGWLLPPERSAPAGAAGWDAQAAYEALTNHGALFFDDLLAVTKLLPSQLEEALRELAALGLVTSDGFAAVRALSSKSRHSFGRRSTRRMSAPRAAYSQGGRWSRFPPFVKELGSGERTERWAWQLLHRYGVMFRDLLARESVAPAWRDLLSVYRQLEMRGEIRGGRFVAGVAGEQFALPETVEQLRKHREAPATEVWSIISAVDPLNLVGIVTRDARVPALRGNRIVFRDGRPIASREAHFIRWISDSDEPTQRRAERMLNAPGALRRDVGREATASDPGVPACLASAAGA
ncbi:MAG TPA: hypothetical protein VHE81_09145, partial [Lacipirellulaceae bacterium]|nr:hypothetical protein [Lacipirellulaceae bacterium]